MASHSANSLTGSFSTLVKRASGIAIALTNQHEDGRYATYGRGASVTGEVSLSSTHGITSVQITLEGKVEMSLNSMTMPYPKVLSLSSTLWDSTRTLDCPSTIPFDLVIPQTFLEPKTGTTYPLPPSFDTAFSLSDLHVSCAYNLIVLVNRSRWTPNKMLTIDVDYVPRNLPSRVMLDEPFPFFDTVKSAPEEWRQKSAILSPKPHAPVGPVHCDWFTPSVRVFAKRDRVPFFLQLRGAESSMKSLYGYVKQGREEGWTQRFRRVTQDAHVAPRITLSIQRQVLIDTSSGVHIARSYPIGTGSLRQVPPGYALTALSEIDVLTVEYEGEIRLDPGLSAAGFDMGTLRVSDFIVLTIEPPESAGSYYENLRQVDGVRIVTG
ncbi:unnamed protein product [Peniophora sp. CBMAI 1063]|nr:unnamed protein product [Peniophora sp. CBMAI 1063]